MDRLSETDLKVFQQLRNPQYSSMAATDIPIILRSLASIPINRPPPGMKIEEILEGQEDEPDEKEEVHPENQGAEEEEIPEIYRHPTDRDIPTYGGDDVYEDMEGANQENFFDKIPDIPEIPGFGAFSHAASVESSFRREEEEDEVPERREREKPERKQGRYNKPEPFLNSNYPHELESRAREYGPGPGPGPGPQQQQPRAAGAAAADPAFESTSYIPDDFAQADVTAENQDRNIRIQKQDILYQLYTKYKHANCGQWSMKLPLDELKYELHRRDQYEEERRQIEFMKKVLAWIIKGIEAGNAQFGPFLELRKWSRSITKDMTQYERPLKAIYHKFFRRKTMNPVLELVSLIVGSAIMWHIQHKVLGEPIEEEEEEEREQRGSRAGRKSRREEYSMQDIDPPPAKFSFSSAQKPSQKKPSFMDFFKIFNK